MTFRVFFRPSKYQTKTVDLVGSNGSHADAFGARVRLSSGGSQALLDAMWEAGMRPTGYVEPTVEKPSRPIMVHGRPISDFYSPDPLLRQDGYNTALGYLARTNPEAVELMGDLVEETKRDGWWLTHATKKAGLKSFRVSAPKVLKDQGVEHVNAYPVEILKRRFGD